MKTYEEVRWEVTEYLTGGDIPKDYSKEQIKLLELCFQEMKEFNPNLDLWKKIVDKTAKKIYELF